MGQARLDPERLTTYLRALSVPNRIDLLRKLQVPCTISELHLRPARAGRGRNPDRALSWQAVDRHVKVLESLGMVHARAAVRDGQPVAEYVVNHARLFLVVEELRLLGLIRPGPEADALSVTALDHEPQAGPRGAVRVPPGPALMLANGPLEGLAFPLSGDGPWTIGRSRGAEVALVHDPFASSRNSVVERDGGRLLVRDVAGSRNGTRLNWRALAEGERAPLAAGDAVGVGRSLLFVRGL